ncbi:hypothetical protein P0W64_04690 [Tsukamurella sp. 8F]|uniref:hypothetical protein n=1 Tax=Tsukamurella sp. 8F TaxID=3031961 RepID=UPI0023B8AAC1|nr:hypothetical protein [Tsukamurella sp. 8F]MDF0586072.1 hypothetical protein [Tsukamurella sp. 8F]
MEEVHAVTATGRLVAEVGRYSARTRFRSVTYGVRGPLLEDPHASGEWQQLAEAIVTVCPQAVLCGWSAARLLNHPMAGSRDRLEVWTPRQMRRAGVVRRAAELPSGDTTVRRGLPCTNALRTAIDLARYEAGDEAIAALDQCLRRRRGYRADVTEDLIAGYIREHRPWRGTRVLQVLAEADGRAESPWETFTRLTLHRGGLTSFVPQVPVLGGTYRLDLADEDRRVGVDYDGAYHRDADQHAADVERWNVLQYDLGWDLVLVTAGPLTNDRATLLRRVRTAMAARA